MIGKSGVKLLHIKRDGPVHSIRELEVNTQLTLSSKKDYTTGKQLNLILNFSNSETTNVQVIILISSPPIRKRTRSTCWLRNMVSTVPKNLPLSSVAISSTRIITYWKYKSILSCTLGRGRKSMERNTTTRLCLHLLPFVFALFAWKETVGQLLWLLHLQYLIEHSCRSTGCRIGIKRSARTENYPIGFCQFRRRWLP